MNTIQSEQAILQCLLKNSSLITECNLSEKDFSTETHSRIYSAILELVINKSSVDVYTVFELIERRFNLNDLSFLVSLFDNAPASLRGFPDYVDSVKKGSIERQAYHIGLRLTESIQNKLEGDHVNTAICELMALNDTDKKYNFTIAEALKNGLDHLEEAHNKEGLVGITTGIKRIDDATGGFQNTDLNVIAARPAQGKTALALNMMLNANCAAGLISAEQGNVQAALRLIAIHGSLDSKKLRTADLDSAEWNKLSGTVVSLQDREIYINDKPRITIGELTRQAREWKHQHDIKILFVDYLQKIQGSNSAFARTEQVTEVTQQLKALARELNIPVVALAQVKRIDERQDKRPKAGDMADASEIEKEADVIMTLYRDEVYNENSDQQGIAEIDLVKNRHGHTGVVRCNFVGPYFQFKDFQRSA